MASSGKNLRDTLEKKLHIYLGDTGTNVIEGWFDTNSADLIEFLNFIVNYISDCNTLSPVEILEYEELKAQGKILHGKRLERARWEVTAEYKGIFELKKNLSVVAILENQQERLLDCKVYLDDVTSVRREQLREKKKSVSAAEMESIKSKVRIERAAGPCLDLAVKLDNVNGKLHDHLTSYKLCTTLPYISYIPLNEFTRCHNDVVTLLNLTDWQFGRKLWSSMDGKPLDEIRDRIFRSTERRRNMEMSLAALREKVQLVDQYDLVSLITLAGNVGSVKSSLVASIRLNREICNMRRLDFKNKLSKAVHKYIDQDTLCTELKNLTYTENVLNYVRCVEENFGHVVSHFAVLYAMVACNNLHLNEYYENLQLVRTYIINDVSRNKLRMEAMIGTIRKHTEHERLPFEKRNILAGSLVHYLRASDQSINFNLRSACSVALQLKSDCQGVEKKLFIDQPETLRRLLDDIDANTKVLEKFISNGPTSEFISLQYRLCKVFRELYGVFASQNDLVRLCVDVLNRTVARITHDEWLKYKRLLWMYFLLEPRRVQRVLFRLEEEVLAQRKKNLK